MPFQDIDEVTTSEHPRQPSGVERILRKLFIEDWNLKLLSLAITLVLWLVVTGQNQPVTGHVNVQLNFIRPASLEISNDPPRTVDVMLTGSRHKLDSLSSLDLVATVDLTDQRPGERVLRLRDRAQITLPLGITVVGFQPGSIPIRLEPISEKQVEIVAKVEGKPAEGYEIYSVHLSKTLVTVSGPASHINNLQKASTETIWVAGHKESFTAQNVAVDVQDTKVDLQDPVVNVEIEIGERRAEKSFHEIPVNAPSGVKIAPQTASVTLLGPNSLLETLRREDLKVDIAVVGETLQPKLVLPTALEGKISLKSLQPSQFIRSK
ncbi:MAG TPA: CdaR family protein [Pyrinomonadaceae bacterium]|nr:CdaR family protein [Pyrinomonadaceae bacterium]